MEDDKSEISDGTSTTLFSETNNNITPPAGQMMASLPYESSIAYSMLSASKAVIKPEMYQLAFDVQTPSLLADVNEDEEFDDNQIRMWIENERTVQTSITRGQLATLDVSGMLELIFSLL